MGAVAMAACTGGQITTGETTTDDRVEPEIKAIPQLPHVRVCSDPAPGEAACHARIRTDRYGTFALATKPQGFGPAELQSAYTVPTGAGSGVTVAIVDAFDDPSAESDLATYRSTFGLPPCTSSNGCFKKVNQNGQASPLPKPDAGWSGEIALDVDMVSAICPSCKILLVEANSPSMNDLGAAENAAVQLGATVVSNSFGGGENGADTSFDKNFFNHPGVAIFASAGDSGFGVEYPAASPNVIAVGGTALAKSSSNARGWVESVWGSVANNNGGTGSGCSKVEAKPSYQKDPSCPNRTVADVAAVADPSTGVAVFNAGKWGVFGGTSAASPIVASIFALTGHGTGDASFIYANTADFFDVTSGANGSCGKSYLCTGAVGYDGPTGNGTPNATAMQGGTSNPPPTNPPPTNPPPTNPPPTNPPPSQCAHDLCATGNALSSSCDPCATQICAKDSFCCTSAWDNICVGEVKSICGQSCGGNPPPPPPPPPPVSSCAHDLCVQGGKLKPSCDPCVAQICAKDAFCCVVVWDNLCVNEVGSICGQSCQ
jgi:hypothetical protein